MNLIKNTLENEGESECKKAGRVYRKGVVITLKIDRERHAFRAGEIRKSGQKMSCFKKGYVMTGIGIF